MDVLMAASGLSQWCSDKEPACQSRRRVSYRKCIIVKTRGKVLMRGSDWIMGNERIRIDHSY